eukprot:1177822-Prorocentrum_minimum.AAC.2
MAQMAISRATPVVMASKPSVHAVGIRPRAPVALGLARVACVRGAAIPQHRVVKCRATGVETEKINAVKVAKPIATLGAVVGLGWATEAHASEQVFGDLAFGLDSGVQALYLSALLALLAAGSFLVVRQVYPSCKVSEIWGTSLRCSGSNYCNNCLTKNRNIRVAENRFRSEFPLEDFS